MLVTLGRLHRGIEHNRHPVAGSRRIDRHLLEGLVGRRRARPHDPGRVGIIVARRVNANPEDRARIGLRNHVAITGDAGIGGAVRIAVATPDTPEGGQPHGAARLNPADRLVKRDTVGRPALVGVKRSAALVDARAGDHLLPDAKLAADQPAGLIGPYSPAGRSRQGDAVAMRLLEAAVREQFLRLNGSRPANQTAGQQAQSQQDTCQGSMDTRKPTFIHGTVFPHHTRQR